MTNNKEEIVKPKVKVLSSSDPQAPYYLYSSNHPGTIVYPIALDGENYANWSHVVRNALKSKNKLGFVNGDLTRPSDASPELDAWEKCNSMVIAWLYDVIPKNLHLHASVAYAVTASKVWRDLNLK